MAANIWQDTDGDWENVLNWSLGTVPAAADTIYIDRGSANIVTNLPAATAGVDYAGLIIGPGFAGSIGSSATPFVVGSVGTPVKFAGRNCQQCFLTVDSGDSCQLVVEDTGVNPDALHLFGGTFASIRAVRARYLSIGALATVTALHIMTPDVFVYIHSGATIGSVYMDAGRVDNHAAIATLLRAAGGVWNHLGETAFNVAALELWGNARFEFASRGGTITSAIVRGAAFLNCDAGDGRPRVITTLNRYGGTTDVSGSGRTVTISTDNSFGGTLKQAVA
jgi:hypothetical protein